MILLAFLVLVWDLTFRAKHVPGTLYRATRVCVRVRMPQGQRAAVPREARLPGKRAHTGLNSYRHLGLDCDSILSPGEMFYVFNFTKQARNKSADGALYPVVLVNVCNILELDF